MITLRIDNASLLLVDMLLDHEQQRPDDVDADQLVELVRRDARQLDEWERHAYALRLLIGARLTQKALDERLRERNKK